MGQSWSNLNIQIGVVLENPWNCSDHGEARRARRRQPRSWFRIRSGQTVLLVLALAGLVSGAVPSGAQTESASEYAMKATYLYNFAKNAEWPEQILPKGSTPLLVGVFGGDDEFIDTLRKTVAGKASGSHPIVVKRVGTAAEMDFCQIIFFRSAARRRPTEAAVAALTGASILLVGEDDGFLRQGGMINFLQSNGKLSYEVNKIFLDRANIRLSPNLLAVSNGERAASNDVPDEPRRVKVRIPPKYPDIAKRMDITGTAQVEVLVARDGSVTEVRVVGGHPLLADALAKAVKGWQYEPAAKESRVLVKFVFGP